MQSFPAPIFDGPELDDMGQKELSARIERVARDLALLKNNPIPSAEKSEWKSPTLYLAIIAAVIALAAWVEPRISSHLASDTTNQIKIEVGDQLKDPLKGLHDMASDIAEIKGKLEILAPLIQKLTAQRLDEAGTLSSKELLARLPELRSLATIAKTESVTVKPETVQKVGNKLIEVGTSAAWSAALDFVNYKSFLNVSLAVKFNNVIGTGTLKTEYVTNSPAGLGTPHFGVLGAVPTEQAAQLLQIGKPDPNGSSPLGNDWIIADGGGLTIDNMQMKKVILRNVYISYSGGPLRMQDVYFINCTFAVKQQPNGQRLVAAALSPPPATTFEAL
jgi:hypothetical protein